MFGVVSLEIYVSKFSGNLKINFRKFSVLKYWHKRDQMKRKNFKMTHMFYKETGD